MYSWTFGNSQRITENHSIEQGGKGSIFSISGLSGNSDIVNDSKVMNNALDSIRDLIKQLTTGKIHHLQLVRSSPKYVDRLVENLKQKLRFVDRCEQMNVVISKKRDATIKDQAEAQSKLKVIQILDYYHVNLAGIIGLSQYHNSVVTYLIFFD